MLASDVIGKKRDKAVLTPDEINWFVAGITDGSVSDAQIGAFAMAVMLNGLSGLERVGLTRAMRDSGDVLHWDLDGPVVDKHSTGGVGDNVSLMLAPALAACGVYVPMISGRGLGHTGGTLDKFDAIPGYTTQPDVDRLRRVVGEVGCAIIGQTGQIAPADKRLYSVRDVTATVATLDLITPSILSKKLAAGLEALVLDVKVGTGAFMASAAEAQRLAQALVAVANDAGCRTTALITDMNEPLASAAGNALEMKNAVAFLRGDEVDSRLWDVTVALGAELLTLSGKVPDVALGRDAMVSALQSGAAAEKFGQMVAALGGPADLLENCGKYLDRSPIIAEIYAKNAGFVQEIDTTALGQSVVELGGGRRVATDAIDYAVGFDWLLGRGMSVDGAQPVARVHARNQAGLERAKAQLLAAYQIGPEPPEDLVLVKQRIP
jgi:thymidine phosphorylase